MNPEAIDTLVIETDSTDFDDFDDDPLADPLSLATNDESHEIPCSVIDTKTDQDQIQLVDVTVLKHKTDIPLIPKTKDPPILKKKIDEQPSCSKAYRPPTPNYELDDLEDLISSSRICVKSNYLPKIETQVVSVEVSEVTPEVCSIEVLDDDNSNISDKFIEKESKENEGKAEEISQVSFFEDFEDQIEQSVLNKTEFNNSNVINETTEKEETPTVSDEIVVKVIEDPKVNENEKIEAPEVIETVTKSLEHTKEPEILVEEPKACTEVPKVVAVDESSEIPDKQALVIEAPLVATISFHDVPTVEVVGEVETVLEVSTSNDIIPPSELDSLSVVVESIDMIQSSSVLTQIQEPSDRTVEPSRDEEDGGLRSDGSDSGLGSEPSHNASVIEKGLSTKTTHKLPDPPAKGNLKRRSSEQIDGCNVIETKRSKKGIRFQGVTVYSFPRQQGFSCVPSQGGCTLGMANQHCDVDYYTLSDHLAEQRRNHRQQLSDMNPRSSSSDDSDSEYEPTDSSSEADSEVYGFLQPVSARQRRALLKSAGVRKIDVNEKDECKMIRTSREVCGCTCRVYCDPDTCACSQAGIKCQVDRPNFPCGCTREGCGNVVGRVEFSPMRVRTHYIHTVMKLQMENKQDRLRSSTNAASIASSNNYKAWQVAQQQQQQPQQQQQSNVRQVPSSSSCVDGRAIIEQPQPDCDFILIDDNRSSIVTDVSVPSSDLHYSYQTSDSSYTNHIIDNVPKPSTSYASTSSYDPNATFMTPAYPEPPQQEMHLYEYGWDEGNAWLRNSYQLPNLHCNYSMQSQMSYQATQYQYPSSSSTPTPTPTSVYPCLQSSSMPSNPPVNDLLIRQPPHHDHIYQNGYNQLQMPEPIYQNQTQVMTGNHYDTSQTLHSVPTNNNCNIIPISNKPLILENGLTASQTSQSQIIVTNGNTENICEIIKKGIVETVSG